MTAVIIAISISAIIAGYACRVHLHAYRYLLSSIGLPACPARTLTHSDTPQLSSYHTSHAPATLQAREGG